MDGSLSFQRLCNVIDDIKKSSKNKKKLYSEGMKKTFICICQANWSDVHAASKFDLNNVYP